MATMFKKKDNCFVGHRICGLMTGTSIGKVTFQELMSFVERKGVNIQTRFLGYTRKEINSLTDFLATLQTALAINVKRNYVEDRDIERTIGIDTDYIEANDFYLEDIDKKFLNESGALAARAFLRFYVKSKCAERKVERFGCSSLLSREMSGCSKRPSDPMLHQPVDIVITKCCS